ncbi:MAG: UDP-4-amino-4,6-dideoxy-N-acetyl-beta-L-altrosamine transaminase [Deltaproteobacteria bacterium]|nr:UDP-4-amino-4,6-dideoxy-N-acetyl-beta-L-altrosamine transaminase [Deltaproteobacteria bacterium]MBW2341763.1 UDP-4-amino-4,6-dideoxy-N-acetyl-beta-L-altrosamine transaminase [Deltaproteobacteria bacterium]
MIEKKKNMLVTGVSGLLGNNLVHYFKDKYEILGLYNSHPVTIKDIATEKCDLSYPDNISRIVTEYRPEILIHCASLTDIDECEKDKDLAQKINVIATKRIVDEVIDKDVRLVYISTDAVYDGSKGSYSEDDAINPQNFYGLSKYRGEREILRKEESLVLRTNIFGWNIQNKKSLGEWIIEELKEKQKISGFKDAFFSSIYTMELARVIDIAIKQSLDGVYNCGASDGCSKYEFCLRIADLFGFDKALVASISIDKSSLKAKRGKNLTLNTQKLQEALHYRLPTINYSIEAFYRDYRCGMCEEIKKKQAGIQERPDIIPYGRQWIDTKDIRAVDNVLRSNRITQGPNVEKFEDTIAKYCGAKFAIAVNSGTSALHIACLASEVTHGNEVITSPITFVASANCAAYCGAKPVFADIEAKTLNIAPEEIEKKVCQKTKAVIPVDFAGQSCDMATIYNIIKKKEKALNGKIFIIEDASHALGSLYKTKRVGSSVFSDMTVLSFHPVKHITTGEGGMVLTNDENLYRKLRLFRSHGITSDPKKFTNADLAFQLRPSAEDPLVNPWYYEQIALGYNYRITDIQCALGISQLQKLNRFRKRRREIVNMYNKAFGGVEYVHIPFESADCNSNFHLYVLRFDFEKMDIDRAQLILELRNRGIQTQVHYIPVHLQPFYQRNFGTKLGDCPNAEKYYSQCLSIPLYPAMTDEDVAKVITTIKDIIKA